MNKEPKSKKYWFDALYDKTKKFLSPTKPQDEISASAEKNVSLNSSTDTTPYEEEYYQHSAHGYGD